MLEPQEELLEVQQGTATLVYFDLQFSSMFFHPVLGPTNKVVYSVLGKAYVPYLFTLEGKKVRCRQWIQRGSVKAV